MTPQSGESSLARLRALGPSAWQRALEAAVSSAPSTQAAASALDRLAEAAGSASLLALSDDELWDLAAVVGSSAALSRYLVSRGGRWPEAFAYRLRENPEPAELERLLDLASVSDADSLGVALRGLANLEMLRLGARDLLGIADLSETVAGLSRLADVCLTVAVRELRAFAAAREGDVVGRDGKPVGFVVLGLGKLGGQELNYSSDIDVAYLYETNEVADDSPAARTFFTSLATEITQVIGERTAEGHVFRVDLRLRPEGNNGPLVNSLENALGYYEGWGDTWERGALAKVRPVAGDLALGEEFVRELRPFIYRRHLDYMTVEDFRRMKARIDAERAVQAPGVRDVKVGRGGIREVEFIVQILQLIHGGHVPEVRCRGTMAALSALVEHELLARADAERLLAAYRFLRNTEHAVQVEQRSQTQRLPSDAKAVRELARRLGYGRGTRGAPADVDEVAGFEADWRRHTDYVHEMFVRFMELRGDEVPARGGDEQQALSMSILGLLADGRAAEAARALESLGLPDGDKAAHALARIYTGRFKGPASPQRRRAVETMAPALLRAVGSCSDPERALDRLVDFLIRTGAHTSYLALLSGSPATMDLLVRLFAGSPYLAAQLVVQPELIDSLVRSDSAVPYRERGDFERLLADQLVEGLDEEAAMSVLRRFRKAELIRIGLNDLSGAIDADQIHAQLTMLAEVCLCACVEVARRLLAKRSDAADADWDAVGLVILAMGKLGAAEMTYGSDLDLIFVYGREQGDFDPDAHLLASRWVQKILSLLQTRTVDGVLYSVDTRLRPSGRSGPLVTSLARFVEYHRRQAELWERQAMIRARVVYGASQVARRLDEVIERTVYSTDLDAAGMQEIADLRRRVEVELAAESADRLNIKTGRGGIVDIEFLVQMLQLRYGHAHAEVRCRDTLGAIRGLRRADLLSADDAEALERHYRFLRRLEARMRLERDRPVEELGTDPTVLARLARRLGFQEADAGAALLESYKATREAVRALYEKAFSPPVPR